MGWVPFSWLECFLDRLLPEACASCGRPSRSVGELFCETCQASSRAAPKQWADGVPVLAPFSFDGPIRAVVHRFKYGDQPELARRLARAAFGHDEVKALSSADTLFVPVPVHRERLVTRGYNQAALLAIRLAQRSRARVRVRALVRLSNTRQQVSLSRSERDENLQAQIVARRPFTGRVVLVDDVFTTGATARACLGAIRAAGATPLAVVTVAVAE
jgi:ComF family protein